MTTQPELLERITVRTDVFGGKPIIRDMRIAVEHALGMLAAGDTVETILDEYPDLTPEDIQACLLFALGDDLSVGIELSVSIGSDLAGNREADLQQILYDRGRGDRVRVERVQIPTTADRERGSDRPVD